VLYISVIFRRKVRVVGVGESAAAAGNDVGFRTGPEGLSERRGPEVHVGVVPAQAGKVRTCRRWSQGQSSRKDAESAHTTVFDLSCRQESRGAQLLRSGDRPGHAAIAHDFCSGETNHLIL
jgi:hypothetical protein